MKKEGLLSCAILLLSVTASCSVYASQTVTSYTSTHLLEKIDQHYFMDRKGRLISYPCSMGGEPLVIYSSVDQKPISSQSTLYPIYLKKGYEASALSIPDFEVSKEVSQKDLIIQTVNPPAAYISIELSRQDGASFYVDTANFPVVNVISGEEGTREKYVSSFNVSINQSQKIYAGTDLPQYNYNFMQDFGLFVYEDVTQIKTNIATWNQNSDWTDGQLGRNYSNIPYRFAPIQVKNKIRYNGFGFWICGSDKKQDDNQIHNQKSYVDKVN